MNRLGRSENEPERKENRPTVQRENEPTGRRKLSDEQRNRENWENCKICTNFEIAILIVN